MTPPTAAHVSIGIPTFNRVATLPRAIGSALAQDYPALDVLVCDNGSTDGTEALCRAWADRDPRLSYFRQPRNLGAAGNFRAALERTTGEWFAWLSDDDWMEPTHVSDCAAELARRSDAAVVAGRICHHTGDQSVVEPTVDLTQPTPFERVRQYFRTVNLNGMFYGLARREHLRQTRVQKALGFDWMVSAALLACGPALTLDHVTLHRSTGGASADYASTARSLNVSTVFARGRAANYTTIAAHVFRQIAWTCPAYRPLGLARRHYLATRAAGTILNRFARPDCRRPPMSPQP